MAIFKCARERFASTIAQHDALYTTRISTPNGSRYIVHTVDSAGHEHHLVCAETHSTVYFPNLGQLASFLRLCGMTDIELPLVGCAVTDLRPYHRTYQRAG